jgi:hypothetical protein
VGFECRSTAGQEKVQKVVRGRALQKQKPRGGAWCVWQGAELVWPEELSETTIGQGMWEG